MRRRAGPGLWLAQLAFGELSPDGHPYRPRRRTWEDLGGIGLRDAQWFFQKWYRPDNATLAVIGNVEIDAARA